MARNLALMVLLLGAWACADGAPTTPTVSATPTPPTEPTTPPTDTDTPPTLPPYGTCTDTLFPVDGTMVPAPVSSASSRWCLADESVDARCVALGIDEHGACPTLTQLIVSSGWPEAPLTADPRFTNLSLCDEAFSIGGWSEDSTGCDYRIGTGIRFDRLSGTVLTISSQPMGYGHCPTFPDYWCCGQPGEREMAEFIRWGSLESGTTNCTVLTSRDQLGHLTP